MQSFVKVNPEQVFFSSAHALFCIIKLHEAQACNVVAMIRYV